MLHFGIQENLDESWLLTETYGYGHHKYKAQRREGRKIGDHICKKPVQTFSWKEIFHMNLRHVGRIDDRHIKNIENQWQHSSYYE